MISATIVLSTGQSLTHFHPSLPCIASSAKTWYFSVAMPKPLAKEIMLSTKAIYLDDEGEQFGL